MRKKLIIAATAAIGVVVANVFYRILLRNPSGSLAKKYIPKISKNRKHINLGTYISLKIAQQGSYSIHMKDPELFRKKLIAAKADGIKEVQIVSDFDFTLSAHEGAP